MASKHFSILRFCLLLHIVNHLAHCQLSAPVASDEHMKVEGNKYLQRHADEDSFAGFDIEDRHHCPQNVQLRWMAEVASSVYATPLITDLYSDGKKEIIVPSFVHYLEVLEGHNGAKALGWPAFHKSTLHSSPLLYDIDFDGIRDVVVATYNGEILFFKDTGEQLKERLQVPRLSVKRNWFAGLKADFIDHSHPDVGADTPTPFAKGHPSTTTGEVANRTTEDDLRHALHEINEGFKPFSPATHGVANATQPAQSPATRPNAQAEKQVADYVQQLREYRAKYGQEAMQKLLDDAKTTNPQLYDQVVRMLGNSGGQEQASSGRRLMGVESPGSDGEEEEVLGGGRRRLMAQSSVGSGRVGRTVGADIDPKHQLTKEAVDSFDVFDDDFDDIIDADEVKRVEEEAKLEGKAKEQGQATPEDAGVPPFDFEASRKEYDALGNKLGRAEKMDIDKDGDYDGLYEGDYPDDFLDLPKGAKGIKPGDGFESGWEEERFKQSDHKMQKDSTLVQIDPHILCTPAIADLDGDGVDELVLAVTYFFDKEYYDDPQHAGELAGADPTKYVAGAIVVFDLHSKTLKWQQHLDLSTDTTTFRAYMYSSPTLVDIDADGKLEVVVGTSMGFLYVLGSDGRCRDNWPVQMGEIQGQPLVADLNGDGEIEIFAADNRGSVALFDKDGRELWERHLRSMISQAAVAGDINGDGELEIVVGSASGHIWALAGDTGEDVKNFPYRTRGKVNAPVLVTRLVPGLSQQLAVMSFDGHLYIVDGRTGCADKVDIGESSYSMVLADDLDGNGRLDLVVATMNGVVYCFETPAEYHPLKAWPQQVQGINGMVARHDYYGVYAVASSRRPRDIAGDKLAIKIEIVDKRPVVYNNGTRTGPKAGPYNISVVLKGVGVQEMGQGAQPVIGVADKMEKAGSYVLEVPCPRTRTTATLRVEMQDANGLLFVDEFPLSFHMHFHKLLKWFITLPLALMVALVLMIKRDAPEDLPLPSYHHNRD